jgi:hypothetical protein
VNVNTFGKLFSRTVDGQVYAQPLYLPGVSIPGKGVCNVVYVATQHNSVFAFDADDPAAASPLWTVNFGPAVPGNTVGGSNQDVLPEIGINSTPVIDIPTGTLYVVSSSVPSPGTTVFRLHALDVTTGAEKFHGPVAIQGTAKGSGAGSVNGVITFDPTLHGQRTGLLLQNGTVYIGFASHGDHGNYHGWVFGYDQKSLRQTAVRNVAPDGWGAGIWQGFGGLAGDGASVYAVTGNGDLGGNNYGQSVIKMSALGGLAITDYFAPLDWALTNPRDEDFGSGGPLLIPGTSLLVASGKSGTLYVMNSQSLGAYEPSNQVVEQWQLNGAQYGIPVFYNSTLYVWPRGGVLSAFTFNGAASNPVFNTVPALQSQTAAAYGEKNEPSISLSSNGVVSGTALVWAAYSASGSAGAGSFPGVLQAYDASTLNLLWSSDQAPANRDAAGGWTKWCPPTVANGKVYLATMDGVLNVFGLLPTN